MTFDRIIFFMFMFTKNYFLKLQLLHIFKLVIIREQFLKKINNLKTNKEFYKESNI